MRPVQPDHTFPSPLRPPPVYPFRHVERKTWLLTLAGLVAAGFAVRLTVTTLNGLALVALCAALAAAAGLLVGAVIHRHFKPVLPQIVGGGRRIIILSGELAFAVFGIGTFTALYINRSLALEPTFQSTAEVVRVGQMRGPRLWGWDARYIIEGRSYYQVVSPEVAQASMKSRTVLLTVQPGRLGFGYIVAAKPR